MPRAKADTSTFPSKGKRRLISKRIPSCKTVSSQNSARRCDGQINTPSECENGCRVGLCASLAITRLELAVRYRLARMAVALIGPEKAGRLLRWAALITFVVGSLADLVVSW
jgi:hypothetical protein